MPTFVPSKRMDGYRRSVMDGLLARKPQAKGAVIIESPKLCVKTTTAGEIAASRAYLMPRSLSAC